METVIIISLFFILIVIITSLSVWISKLKRTINENFIATHQLHYEMEHDTLTGLANGTLLIDRLSQSIKNAKRQKKHIAVLYLNLDHFTKINDSFGTGVGDEFLKVLSQKLLTNLRESDTIARLGGDEFIMVLDNFEEVTYMKAVVAKIMNLSQETFIVQGHKINITFSIGVSVYPGYNNEDIDTLLKNASLAMHDVKNNTRDGYKFYTSELINKTLESEKLKYELLESLEKNQMQVHYQLQIDSNTRDIIGMEALLRWDNPRLGLLLPKDFLTLAESTNFIIDLDEWVIRTCITQFTQWREENFHTGDLSLNLSLQKLQEKSFTRILGNLIQQNIDIKEYLNFELCESQLMQDPEKYKDNLKKLSQLGVQLTLDNFSIGCSSLEFLNTININKVKLPPKVINELPHNTQLLKAAISIAKSFNFKIMAVGVETKEQLELLNQNACNEIQGHLYHKPAPASSIERILKERGKK